MKCASKPRPVKVWYEVRVLAQVEGLSLFFQQREAAPKTQGAPRAGRHETEEESAT